jgi:hypothetical protein
MRKLIVGFSHSTKKFAPFSWLIRFWDKTPYSHVYFQFETSKNKVEIVYQASSTMLNYMSKDVFLTKNAVVEEFEFFIDDERYDFIMLNCMKSAGLEYSVKQVFGLVIADLFNMESNPLSDEKRYVCSEWVAEELQLLGYRFNKTLDLITPKDIYKVLKEQNPTCVSH